MSAVSPMSAPPAEVSQQTYPFSLPDLPYAYDALEPHIDQKTMQLHHREHHAAYVKKLNEALATHAPSQRLTLAQLLGDGDALPADIRVAVRNNGGGHLNHDFFWRALTPAPAKAPQGQLAVALNEQFGSFDGFRKRFSDVAAKHFASGWVALAVDHTSKKLEIVDLKDHEVLRPGQSSGLIILDVWEHAYYVKYQNRRPEFIAAYWSVVNWKYAGEVFARAGAR